MEQLKLCDSDYRFMSVVWEYAPIPSGKLVKLCNEILGWKKSTTYTTIKKMSEKGYIKNENAVVTVLISKSECREMNPIILLSGHLEVLFQIFLLLFWVERKSLRRRHKKLKILLTVIVMKNSRKGGNDDKGYF